jgi:hypothetical protein
MGDKGWNRRMTKIDTQREGAQKEEGSRKGNRKKCEASINVNNAIT